MATPYYIRHCKYLSVDRFKPRTNLDFVRETLVVNPHLTRGRYLPLLFLAINIEQRDLIIQTLFKEVQKLYKIDEQTVNYINNIQNLTNKDAPNILRESKFSYNTVDKPAWAIVRSYIADYLYFDKASYNIFTALADILGKTITREVILSIISHDGLHIQNL